MVTKLGDMVRSMGAGGTATWTGTKTASVGSCGTATITETVTYDCDTGWAVSFTVTGSGFSFSFDGTVTQTFCAADSPFGAPGFYWTWDGTLTSGSFPACMGDCSTASGCGAVADNKCATGCCTGFTLPDPMHAAITAAGGSCTLTLHQTGFTPDAGVWAGSGLCAGCPVAMTVTQCVSGGFKIDWLDDVTFPETTNATATTCSPFEIDVTGTPIFTGGPMGCLGNVTAITITA